LDFLRSQNADLGNVEIGFDADTGMRGLFATKKVSKGKLLCKIPSDCALALSDPSRKGDDAPTIAHGGANFLSMYVHDAKANALWSPYLDTLPKEVGPDEMTPDFFDDEEVELLEFPRLVDGVKRRKGEIRRVAQEKGLDEKELRFAAWLVSSRAFLIQIMSVDGDGNTAPASAATTNSEEEVLRDEKGQVISSAKERKSIRVMVPFLDMANHRSEQPNAQLKLIDPEKDDAWFALEATRNINPGKEVTISYGSGLDSSVELLSNYGFVDRTNRIDRVMLEKGGDGCIADMAGWTTTLEEDKAMLDMLGDGDKADDENDAILRKILTFRIKMKESYKED